MTQPEQQAPQHSPTRDEIIEQAALEGHDADIPGSLGYIDEKPGQASGVKDEEKDLERGIVGGSSVSSATELGQEEQPERDPNIVDFDGPDDPENPLNWHPFKKWGAVALVSAITFLTPLASSQFAPGVPELMREFHSSSTVLAGFVVSVYVLGYAVGPLIIAPLSEMYGRLPLYHSCNLLFVIFTIAAAVAKNMGQFIVFRFFMGCFGGAPLVLGGGTIADLIHREQRGTAMAVWMMGPTVGPCAGPIIGGFLTVAKGWRWNFWFVAIVGGAFFLMSVALMSETSPIIILERKAKRLRASTGNPKLRSKLDNGMTPKQLLKYSIVRPMKMLFTSAVVIVISVYIAIVYSYYYILFTTFTGVFEKQYHWKGGVVGLSYLGVGLGSLIGQISYVYFGNKSVNRHIKRGDFKPEHRMPLMCLGAFLIPAGLFMYGWCVQYKTHWIAPIIATGITGVGILYMWMPATTYLVDVFTIHAASAMAANTVLRSLLAAFLPLAGPDMYKAMGYGWGNSLLGFVAVAMIPVPFVFLKYGERIRLNSKVNF